MIEAGWPDQDEKAEAFRALHEGEPFVIPNPWDAGSAQGARGARVQGARHDERRASPSRWGAPTATVDARRGRRARRRRRPRDRPAGLGRPRERLRRRARGRRAARSHAAPRPARSGGSIEDYDRDAARSTSLGAGGRAGRRGRRGRARRSTSRSRSPPAPRTSSAATPTSTTRSRACRPTRRPAPTSSTRPGCAAPTRSRRSATPSRSRSTCSPSAARPDARRDRRGRRASGSASAAGSPGPPPTARSRRPSGCIDDGDFSGARHPGSASRTGSSRRPSYLAGTSVGILIWRAATLREGSIGQSSLEARARSSRPSRPGSGAWASPTRSPCGSTSATFSGGMPRLRGLDEHLADALELLAVEALRVVATSCRVCSSIVSAPLDQIGVSMLPGSTTTTSMSHGAQLWRRDSPSASTANLEVLYGDMNGLAMRPPIEAMKTIVPRPPADQRQERLGDGDLADQVHLEHVRGGPAGRDDSIGPPSPTPALLTSPTRPSSPTASRTFSLAEAIERSLVTSIVIGVSRSEPGLGERLRVLAPCGPRRRPV